MINFWNRWNHILKLIYTLTLVSRAYQAVQFDLPLRSFFWDQGLLSPIAEFFGISWSQYLQVFSDSAMVNMQWIFTLVWLLSAFLIWIDKWWIYCKPLFRLSLILYGILILLLGKEQFYRLGQYLEYGLQFWIVFIFCFSQYFRMYYARMFIALACALTFIAHGLYAVNFYPRPGYFVQMTINILNCSEAKAKLFLNIMGGLDFVMAILVLLPGKWRVIGFIYCVYWGFLTAFARLWSNFELTAMGEFASRWLYEFFVRTAHFMGPLFGLNLMINSKDK